MPANIEEKIKHQSHTYMAVSTQKTSAFNVTLEESPMRTSGNLIYKVLDFILSRDQKSRGSQSIDQEMQHGREGRTERQKSTISWVPKDYFGFSPFLKLTPYQPSDP